MPVGFATRERVYFGQLSQYPLPFPPRGPSQRCRRDLSDPMSYSCKRPMISCTASTPKSTTAATMSALESIRLR
jgi:hypothetical protein